jgi:DNA-binding protein HU-beta
LAKTMTKAATLAHLAQKTNLSKKQVAEVFEETLNLATKEAKNGFVLPGFGKLVLANRKARIGRNPQTRPAGFARSPIWSWPRACPSSCGAACRTTSS